MSLHSLADILRDALHAVRVWARDPDRRIVCPECRCKHRGAR